MRLFLLEDEPVTMRYRQGNGLFRIGLPVKADECFILIVHQGTASFEINFVTYEVLAGTQLVALPGTFFHCTEVSDDFVASCIAFTPEIFAEVTLHLSPAFFGFLKEYPCATVPQGRFIGLDYTAYLFEEIYRDAGNIFREQIIRNILQGFLLDIYDKTKGKFFKGTGKSAGRQEELFGQFIALIHRHSGTQREVAFYANELCITRHYLSAVVQSVTGETAKSIVDRHCVQEIKMQLRTTTDSVQEISARLDFPDQSFFTRYFKKHTGITPLAYRSLA